MKQWIEARICEVCETAFDAKMPSAARQITCSRPCRYKRYRASWPESRTTGQWARTKDLALQRNYGITFETYQAMLEEQHGLCFICHEPPVVDKLLCVDHDHSTGKVRKLLCERCNFGLGSFKDSIERLNEAIKYIQLHSDFTPE